MIRALVAIAAAALMTPGLAAAAPCKDAKGKFVKCPPAPAIAKDAKGRCRIASGPKKGQLAKCP